MTGSRFLINAILAAIVSLTAACKASESGAIPCNDDSNCPSTYAQCIGGGAGSSAGHCTEPVVGTPGLSPTAIAVTPPAITGGLRPTLSLALPALSGTKGLARKVTLGLAVGGGQEPVNKSGGAPVTLADLGTTITVDAPASSAADDKTLTYTLTVSNTPSSAATATATGSVHVVPQPLVAASTFDVTPASITGGNTTTISLTLPTLMSAPNSASAVTFAVSGPAHCGSGAVPKAGGGLVGIDDLTGTPISINSPTGTAATDDLACTYTLTVANSVGTHVQASGSFLVLPVPVLTPASLTFPAVSGGATTAGVALPALSQLAPAKATVQFAIISGTGCPAGNVNKANNGVGPVAPTDLNTTISFAPPTSATIDDKACVYKLTVSNGAAFNPAIATVTGTLIVAPAPALASPNFTLTPASITGGTPITARLFLTLPALSSAAPVHSTNTVTFAISGDPGCGAADVPKAGGSVAVGTADLSQPISINPLSTSPSSHLSCAYTLALFNAANAQVAATGALTVVPKPVFSSTSLTILPNDHIAGGSSSSALLNTILPSLTSDPTYVPSGNVTLTISGGTVCGSGNVSKIVSAVSSPVVKGDLGSKIFFNPPTSLPDSSDVCTYTISAANSTGTPEGTATATGTLTIVPTPSFGSNALTVTPNVFVDGTSTAGLLKFALPLLSLGTADSIAMKVSSGGPSAVVMKTGSVPFDKNDLGTTVAVDPPVTNPGDASKIFTYSLTANNNLSGTSAGISATATSFPAGADLASPRIGSTSTLLPNGKVLIVGGGASISKGICTYSATTGNPGDSDTADIYDPAAGTITAVPSALVSSRCLHTAVFVPTTGNIHTGKVFIMGGANDATASKNVKIDVFLYNDATANVFGAWQSTTLPVMQVSRVGHSATLLGSNAGSNNGKIIIAGGYQPGYTQTTGSGLDTAELFDPAGGSGNGTSALYSGTGSNFLAGRGEHAAVLAGKWLLIIGGYSPSANAGVGNFSPSVDAIDTTVSAVTNNPFAQTDATTMTLFANPAVGRFGHSAIALNSTAILVAGGVPDRSGSVRASMQKYTLNQSSGLITGTGALVNLNTGRARFQLLAAGPVNKYLAFGGSSAISITSAIDTATNSVEVVTADTGSTLATANSGTMASARQALTATNLKLSGASNFTFLIAGGAAATGGAELFLGP